ncbi:hypothetical protein CASFOL_017848 [Castilleja foliolosa]|uniref:RRM domain-containing protein n=1 Tax=Castilleja foliolosa TaxID=1961234 RepID=A0ABD3DCG3_9LAMI
MRHEEKSGGGFSNLDGSEVEKQEADKSNILAHAEVVTDMDYLRSRIKKKWSDSESSDDEGSVDGTGDELDVNIIKSKQKDGFGEGDGLADPSSSPRNKNDDVLEPGRLYIRNIPYSATEEELEEHFSKYGTISQVHIVIDKETRRVTGNGFVLLAVPESAGALVDTEGPSFQGRVLHVEPAKQRYQSDAPEKIVENIARKFGVGKSEFLDRESNDLA